MHLHQVFLFWWGAACGAIVRYNVLGLFVINLLKVEGGYYVLIEGHLSNFWCLTLSVIWGFGIKWEVFGVHPARANCSGRVDFLVLWIVPWDPHLQFSPQTYWECRLHQVRRGRVMRFWDEGLMISFMGLVRLGRHCGILEGNNAVILLI